MIWVLLLALTCVLQANAQSQPSRTNKDPHLDAQQYMDILGQAITLLQDRYVDSINWSKALYAGINAALYELDPYTEFYSEEDQNEWKTMTTGEYGGVGALIQQDGDTVIIANPYPEKPAAQAGLRAGDAILAIDGEPMLKKTTAQVSEKLRGEAGTTLKLSFLRPYTDSVQTVEITRKKIALDAVTYYGWVSDSIAYIQLEQFTDKASLGVQSALLDLRADTKHTLGGLVLDLRSNPGGLVEEAVKIVSMFVPKGSPVVETKAKLSQWNSTFRTNTHPIEPNLPMVVLVDRGSASASEIVSGAMQDLDRAVVLGERTFGKGLVQSSASLPYNTIIKYTSAKYYIPSGRCIQAIDYSHRNEDGSVGRIPDSLTHVFHTAHGREVRDGGGIQPDVAVKPQVMSHLLWFAMQKNVTFDFATRYRHFHDSIPPVEDFHITDEDYREFCGMMSPWGKDSLLKEYRIDLAHDLDSLRSEISEALESEIALRYYSTKGRTYKYIEQDLWVAKAKEILRDKKRYKSILKQK
mgnify:CR=1 FL=1